VRVCVVTSRFFPDYGGGARQALGLSQKLLARGAGVFVVTAHNRSSATVGHVKKLVVIRLPRPTRGTFALLKFYVRLLTLLLSKRHLYDIIHSQAIHHHTYVACVAGKLLRKPAVAKISLPGHDDPASIAKRRFGKLQTRFLSFASVLITARRHAQRAASQWGWPADRMAYIPNGVDVDKFRPPAPSERLLLRRTLDVNRDRFVAVYVGVIAFRKGIDTLIDSWPGVVANDSTALLLLAGPVNRDEHWAVDPAYVSRMREKVSEKGLSENVRFLGNMQEARLPLQASDLFVLASRSEGMPNALLEAMACGLPFAATRLDTIEEMAPEEQIPYLAAINDAAELTKQIVTLAGDRDLRVRLGRASRRRAEQLYSFTSVAERHVRLYHELLGRPYVQSNCPGP